jgi:hypothetical protein
VSALVSHGSPDTPQAIVATHLCAKAVSQAAKLLDTIFLLQGLDSFEDNGVDGLLGVGVVALGALGQPGHEVEALGAVQGNGVAVEDINDQGEVAISGKLVGHQLAVLPDADDVGDVEEANALVLVVGRRRGEVGVVLAGDLDGGARRGAPAQEEVASVHELGWACLRAMSACCVACCCGTMTE